MEKNNKEIFCLILHSFSFDTIFIILFISSFFLFLLYHFYFLSFFSVILFILLFISLKFFLFIWRSTEKNKFWKAMGKKLKSIGFFLAIVFANREFNSKVFTKKNSQIYKLKFECLQKKNIHYVLKYSKVWLRHLL